MVEEVDVQQERRSTATAGGTRTFITDRAEIAGVKIEHTAMQANTPWLTAKIQVDGLNIEVGGPASGKERTLTVGGVALNNPELAAQAFAAVSGSLRDMKFTTAEAQQIRQVVATIKAATR